MEEETDGSWLVLRRHLIQSPGWLGTQFSDQVGLELTAMFMPSLLGAGTINVSHQVQLAERSWLNPSKSFPLEYQSFFLWVWGFSYKPLVFRSWAKMFLAGKVCIGLSQTVCWGQVLPQKPKSVGFSFFFSVVVPSSFKRRPFASFSFFPSSILKILRGS